MPEYFCSFCHAEVSEEELRNAISDAGIHDIEVLEKLNRISVLMNVPHLRCSSCGKDINLNEDGLIVLDKTEKKMRVKIEG